MLAPAAAVSENHTSSMNDGDINPTMSTTQQGRNRGLAPAFIQKQMQQAVAVGAMTYVYGLEAMKLKQVYQKLFDSFHGNPTSGLLPMVNDLVTGGNAYAILWDRSEDGQKTIKSSSLGLLRNMICCFILALISLSAASRLQTKVPQY